MNELKPCPFCGALPTTEVRVTQMGGTTDNVDFSICCTECDTHKTIRLKISKRVGCFADVEKAMQQAIEAWNRRVE